MQPADTSKGAHYLEQELREELRVVDGALWDFIQTGSLDGVWYWDLEQPDNEWMSPEFWKLLGIDPATRRHDPAEWQDIIFKEDLDVALENFRRHCEDPDHPYDQIVRYRHADGSTVWVRCRGIAIRDETGKPIRMLGTHNDVTKANVLAESLRQEKLTLTNVNEELRAFAYSVSHDLKSPSNTVAMLLQETLHHSGTEFTEDGRFLMDEALKTLNHMSDIIEDVLRYTRVIGEDPVLEPVDLNATINDVVQSLQHSIADADAKVTVDALPVIEGHQIQLSALFQNLLDNALKYRKPDQPCRIHVSGRTHENPGKTVVSVADAGIGIPIASRERIFGMFKRLKGAHEQNGVGLGLALSRRVALNHGGDIAVTDPPDGFATNFDVTLSRKAVANGH